ncbi:MAG: hydrogenase maturation nickel metallochaperone HypA [Lachnospiraceae bacterium]|nr:hydrogenase maturation nickel metallochaperone HypA [Lachnospiraceae bacterium]
MHELGVVFYVIKDVKKVAEENNIKKVESVTVEIGEVSGVVHSMLKDCWDWAKKKEPVTEDTELKIETIEAVTFCEDCEKDYPTVKYGKKCPHCGSEHTFLKTGNEFMIKEIGVKDEDN